MTIVFLNVKKACSQTLSHRNGFVFLSRLYNGLAFFASFGQPGHKFDLSDKLSLE